jgi:RNA polymerase sigma factor (sigma-70 family)
MSVRARDREAEEWWEIVESLRPAVLQAIEEFDRRRRFGLRDSDLAEEVMLDLIQCPEDIRAGREQDQRKWINEFVTRAAHRLQRHARRIRSRERSLEGRGLEESLADWRPSPVEEVERTELIALIESILPGLTEWQREVICLHCYGMLTLTQAATQLGITRASADALLYRGVESIRKRIGTAEKQCLQTRRHGETPGAGTV